MKKHSFRSMQGYYNNAFFDSIKEVKVITGVIPEKNAAKSKLFKINAGMMPDMYKKLKAMQKYFFIKTNGKYIKINFQDIIYMEGCRNYIKLVTDTKVHLVLFSMKGMEQQLPSNLFRRIHKSYIISLDKITGFDSEKIYLTNKELPIGQQYKNELERAVVILNDAASDSVKVNSFYSVPMVVSRNPKSKIFEA